MDRKRERGRGKGREAFPSNLTLPPHTRSPPPPQNTHTHAQDVCRLVQTLFGGTYSYVTTCRSCGRESASSSNLTEFMELTLMVKGMKSLVPSLVRGREREGEGERVLTCLHARLLACSPPCLLAHLHACLLTCMHAHLHACMQVSALECEDLVGSNQYSCEFCGGKRDASRQMVLRRTPPYLCLQLQRFEFDYQVSCSGSNSNTSWAAGPSFAPSSPPMHTIP
jgi:hypothetical protein